MENFIAYNPTRLHFGKDVTNILGRTAKQYGKRVLLIYGQGSVKKYGYYDQIMGQLGKAGLEVIEYPGIKPNPVVEDVDAAAELGRKEEIDVIVALGGGSVIDSAKITALAIASGKKAWDIMKNKVILRNSTPLITVLTLAATGTEMNAAAVIQNHETGEKIGLVNELNFPKHSFLDPQFTVSVPLDYTAYGVADLIAHALEAYFGEGDA
ncbi:MAG: iron-containing alcohol dehydrogenase, partial [Bacteroidales bacterium]|nr:iron-containing alcohol dehydrogenase [Bacteroidales bacterium]